MSQRKYIFKPEDYVDAPVPKMGKFTRKMIIDSNTVGAKELTFLYAKIDAQAVGGDYEKKHSHSNAEEIVYITGGKGYLSIDDKKYLVEKGDTIWLPKKAKHCLYNPFDEPAEALCIYSRASLKDTGFEVHE